MPCFTRLIQMELSCSEMSSTLMRATSRRRRPLTVHEVEQQPIPEVLPRDRRVFVAFFAPHSRLSRRRRRFARRGVRGSLHGRPFGGTGSADRRSVVRAAGTIPPAPTWRGLRVDAEFGAQDVTGDEFVHSYPPRWVCSLRQADGRPTRAKSRRLRARNGH
jgi:hypothetical protein